MLSRLSAVAAVLLLATTPAATQSQSFYGRIAALRAAANVPAVGGVTFSSSSIGTVAVAGVRKLGDPADVTTGDLWHVGSITKSFTSTLAAKFVERGDLNWDATLGEVLGVSRAQKFSGATLRNVLSHRAGLPANPPAGMMGSLYQTTDPLPLVRRRVVDLALATEPLSVPGTTFLYSNLDYILIGSILEEKTGKSWEDLVRAEVLVPLRLTSAGFGAPGTAGAVTQPRGHRAQGTALIPMEPGVLGDNPAVFGPAGTLHMSIADLARWGQEHLRGERGQDGLLKAATFKTLHAPPAGDYAFGWVSQMKGDAHVIWHNGSNTMWYAIVGFNADADKGVVLVTNGSINARAGLDALAFELTGGR